MIDCYENLYRQTMKPNDTLTFTQMLSLGLTFVFEKQLLNGMDWMDEWIVICT